MRFSQSFLALLCFALLLQGQPQPAPPDLDALQHLLDQLSEPVRMQDDARVRQYLIESIGVSSEASAALIAAAVKQRAALEALGKQHVEIVSSRISSEAKERAMRSVYLERTATIRKAFAELMSVLGPEQGLKLSKYVGERASPPSERR